MREAAILPVTLAARPGAGRLTYDEAGRAAGVLPPSDRHPAAMRCSALVRPRSRARLGR